MMFEREPILQGLRLSVRPFIASDVGSAYLGWLNDPEVTRFSNQRFKRHDAISALTYLTTFDGSDNRFLLVCDTESARPIGTLTVYASRPHGTADIGIMIGERKVWGKGIGAEAFCLVLSALKASGSAPISLRRSRTSDLTKPARMALFKSKSLMMCGKYTLRLFFPEPTSL